MINEDVTNILCAYVCVLSHIWCSACDIAAPVVSSSTVLQGAEVLKVCSWEAENIVRIQAECRK